ncbi:hypothetical protein ACHAXR_004383, partial [Thalassiosira sp. AJA248-18]
MKENGDRIDGDNDNDGGESSNGRHHQHQHRRLPLHSHYRTASIACCLLLASSSITLASASAYDEKTTTTPSLLRGRGGGNSRTLAASKFCPDEYTGKAPTTRCAGYVGCVSGKQTSSVQPCASGTVFDVKSSTCTWPDKVVCKVGEELLDNGGKGGDDDEDEEDEVSKFCPARYTGRAPTSQCKGYVQCNKGKGGLSVNCPPKTTFNSMSNLCEYNLDKCEMLAGEDNTTKSNEPNVNELDKFCPRDYTGRAPTKKCAGYVDCKNGKAKRSKQCPGETKFDIMILACTYNADMGCDALQVDEEAAISGGGGGGGPTASPVTSREERIKELVVGCPEGHTGHITLPGCQQYIWCAGGNEITKFNCPDGTLFNGQYCGWADTITCETTQIPTLAPSGGPTMYPTGEPTYTPTELDMEGDIYYPNFSDGTCRGDGNYPPNVGRQYLFSQSVNCCETYFPTNMENCLKKGIPSPAPTPTGGKQWYPDYANSVCKNDPDQHGAFETNFFYDYQDCCYFEWIQDTVKCLRNEPVIAYYPDYNSNSCKADGMQSPFENNLFDSLEDCCHFEWIDYGLCITAGVDSGGGGSTGSDSTDNNSLGVVTTGIEFYPDYKHNVCHCDGKQGEFEINIFNTYEACCQFEMIDGNICRQYKNFQEEKCIIQIPAGSLPSAPSSPSPPRPSPPTASVPNPNAIWYPDLEKGLCRDDGKEPKGLLLTLSYQVCCKRFMPSSRQACNARSEAASMTLNNGSNTSSGGSASNNGGDKQQPHCYDLSKGQCNRDPQCQYNSDWGKCVKSSDYGNTSVPPPTPRPPQPTPRPPQPTPAASPADACSGKSKKKCLKDSACQFDTFTEKCYLIQQDNNSGGAPAPVAAPSPPSSSSASNNSNSNSNNNSSS